MSEVTEKIRKLLALATGKNEHEAAAALLKARAMMAKYKVDERSLADAPARPNVLNKMFYTKETYSGLVNSWFIMLSHVIADNHCCAAVSNGYSNRTTRRVVFTGLDEDPAVALEVFDYAVQHIHAKVKEYGRYIRETGLYPKDEIRQRVRAWEASYAEGFCRGLQAKYDEQLRNDDTGTMALTVVKPVEVTDYVRGLKSSCLRIRHNGDNEHARRAGFTAGYTFNPTKQLAGE